MKALSLWQPWASLVALGVKTIETRSWNTSHRGPLAVHATKRKSETLSAGGWLCRPSNADGRSQLLAPGTHNGIEWNGRPPAPIDVPLGAVVATCELVDVVPMVNIGEEAAVRRIEIGTVAGEPNLMLCSPHSDRFDFDASDYYERDVTDQLPYGDFRPGRYGWLLENIKPLDEPIPARGKQGLWEWTP